MRDVNDKWVRILVQAGDLVVLAAGVYHRFTLTLSDYIHVIRVFKDDPQWTPINRPLADGNKERHKFVQKFGAIIASDWQKTTSAPLM